MYFVKNHLPFYLLLNLFVKVIYLYSDDEFLLFLNIFSKQAVFDGKKAIRGGVPVVFRKF